MEKLRMLAVWSVTCGKEIRSWNSLEDHPYYLGSVDCDSDEAVMAVSVTESCGRNGLFVIGLTGATSGC